MKELGKWVVMLATAVASPCIAFAAGGGWAGGGGLIRKDSTNPWWIKNTKEVRVCVEVDESNFGISAERARELTAGSLSWWKTVFQKSETIHGSTYSAGVGRQNFQVVNGCDAEADLRVQFGVLHPDQLAEWAKNVPEPPQRYRGIAIRTHYDTVAMRGKGFVYLAPQKGPLKMEAIEGQVSMPWNYANGRLAGVLLSHELGHVFGYDHGSLTIMNPAGLERVFNPDVAKFIAEQPIDFFFPNPLQFDEGGRTECYEAGYDNHIRRFWNLPEGDVCLSVQVKEPGSDHPVAVYSGPTQSGPWTLVAETDVSDVSTSSDSSYLYLPSEQQVLPHNPGVFHYPMPSVTRQNLTVRLQMKGSETTRSVFLVFEGSWFDVMGSANDEIDDVLTAEGRTEKKLSPKLPTFQRQGARKFWTSMFAKQRGAGR